IQLRRRDSIILAVLILAAGRVSGIDLVQVPISVKCTEGQDCILSCSFDYTAGGWDEKSGVIWRRAESDHIVHRIRNNTDQLADQSPQYVSRTSLFDSELQRGNASLLLRRVREGDAGKYKCSVYAPRLSGSGLSELVVVPAQRHQWWVSGAVLLPVLLVLCVISCLCVVLWLYKKCAGHRWKSNLASSPAQAVSLSDVIEEPSEIRNNTDQLADQSPQYVSRTSLFDSELQRGNASLLLRRVREGDAGKYKCSVYAPRLSGSGLTEVVVVPAQRHHYWVSGALLFPVLLVLCVISCLCVGLWLYKKRAGHRWKFNLASIPAQAVSLSDVIEEPSEIRPLPCTAQFTQFNTSSQN
ncbi:UNVERIFIED_CONTAM: hypothetical protein FKN15_022305, partial [Acipenser sinensis]